MNNIYDNKDFLKNIQKCLEVGKVLAEQANGTS